MGKKLLVADDSLTIQKIIKLALSNDGYEIQTVSDGNDAIQQISLFRPDVVLLDVSLPGKTAFEVKTRIDAQGDASNIRFVLMSSAFEKIDENRANAIGFHGRLTKPFDPPQLREVLSTVLAQIVADAPSDYQNLDLSDLPDHNQDDDKTFLNLSPPPLPEMKREFTAFPEGLPSTFHDSSDSDIKHLTESTVKMSGLGDFDWNITETARKMPEKAHENIMDNLFQLDPPSDELISLVETEDHHPEHRQEHQVHHDEPKGMMMTDSQIEKIVQDRLEKMAQAIIPEIAERIIKQEIRKMLQDPL